MYSFFKKIFIVILAVVSAVVLFFLFLWLPFLNKSRPIDFGVSFSKPYAEFLGLDWRATYLAILDDLGVKYIRLESEWNHIEKKEGVYDFEALDWQIAEAERRDVKVLLVVGRRQPRWPECHIPAWLADAPQVEIKERTLEFIKKVVERYKDSPAIEMWQVENEPLFNFFGECPKGDKNFLKNEIALVKSLDDRPILITDSGELSTWRRTAYLGDYFGSTLFRVVYNPYFGYFYHFYPPSFYRLKAKLVGLELDKVFIVELQTETWVKSGSIPDTPIEEQKMIMDAERIGKHLDFARRTGFSRAYLWGVEWWYWLRKQGDDSVWEIGQELWKNKSK